MTLRTRWALLPFHLELLCQELLDRFIWNKNFHTWATAQKVWHHFWEVLKTLWTYFLKILQDPLHIHDLAGAKAGCASIFQPDQGLEAWKFHEILLLWDFQIYTKFYRPKRMHNSEKKYREKVYQLSDTTVDMFKLGWITRGCLRVWLLNSSLEEKTSYCFIGLPLKLNHSWKFLENGTEKCLATSIEI